MLARITRVSHPLRFVRQFSTSDAPPSSGKVELKSFKTEEAKIGENVFPAKFNVEDVMSNIDPMTNLKKEQSLEFKELPADGKHDPTTYHVMKSLKPFKDTSNDISKEYGVKVKGLEPTRFGDWERRGRCTDF